MCVAAALRTYTRRTTKRARSTRKATERTTTRKDTTPTKNKPKPKPKKATKPEPDGVSRCLWAEGVHTLFSFCLFVDSKHRRRVLLCRVTALWCYRFLCSWMVVWWFTVYRKFAIPRISRQRMVCEGHLSRVWLCQEFSCRFASHLCSPGTHSCTLLHTTSNKHAPGESH